MPPHWRPLPEPWSAPLQSYWRPRRCEQDHFVVPGQAVCHCWVPMVHRAGKVLVEDQRHAVRLTEATIGEANAIGLDELRRRGLMGICGHVVTSFGRGLGQGRCAPSERYA